MVACCNHAILPSHQKSEPEQIKDSSAEHLEISNRNILIWLQPFNFLAVRHYRREPSPADCIRSPFKGSLGQEGTDFLWLVIHCSRRLVCREAAKKWRGKIWEQFSLPQARFPIFLSPLLVLLPPDGQLTQARLVTTCKVVREWPLCFFVI